MFHHYMQRGHDIHELMSLSETEKLFYKASMVIEIETLNRIGGDMHG